MNEEFDSYFLEDYDDNRYPRKFFADYEAIERIGLSGVLDGDLTPLLNLPQLKEAYLDEGLREKAEKDLPHAAFRIIYP